jgi:tetratricopeptide (TPR) repeat protein
LSAALAAWLALGPNAAAAVTAQDTARARELGQEAAELFRAGQYEAALEKFTEANRLVPHPNLDVNIGRAYEKLEQFDQALIHCKIALNAPGVQ